MKQNKFILDGNSLSLKQIDDFLHSETLISLSKEAEKKVLKSRSLIDKWVSEDKVVYGVTTGFGEFANVKISNHDLDKLQENLILSHSAGVGELLPPHIVKIMMLLRANALAKGYSGIRLKTLQHLIGMINNNIIPDIPSRGSVGSSGDLVPLAHLVLAMIGKGNVKIISNILDETDKSRKSIKAKTALKRFSMNPVKLGAKEGLALINGTQMMTAFASFICIEAGKLSKITDIAAALSHEALRASDKPYDKRVHELRPYQGQLNTAQNMMNLLAGSQIRESHRENDPRVQDSYSIRCIPQIHGASKDVINYASSQVEVEINSATDNPLIFPHDGDFIEAGNFHGQPMAYALDFLSIALSELANVSERRTERLVNGSLSGLPRFLTKMGGLHSGMMIAQYTAAALVSENKVLSHPASVDSIPTSANQEDHNSMGSVAAFKCYEILKNVRKVISIELMTAAQGIEFVKPLRCGKGTSAAYNVIRSSVPPLVEDRVLSDDIKIIEDLVKSGILLKNVEKQIDLET